MPTATSFTALGKGNGFLSCPTGYEDFFGDFVYPSRVNVSNYSVWTTLGGYNSNSVGTVTEEQIDLSRRRAMQLYWNLHQVNCSLSAVSQGATNQPYSESITNVSTTNEPRERVCGFTGMQETSESLARCFLGATPQPLWLFEGDVGDWGNFIGFSVGQQNASELQLEFINSYALSTGVSSTIKVECAANGGTLTTLSGYPFVCTASGDTTNEADFSASSDGSGTTPPPDSEPFTRTSSISITSLDFYTY
jgi:hypothetical protein